MRNREDLATLTHDHAMTNDQLTMLGGGIRFCATANYSAPDRGFTPRLNGSSYTLVISETAGLMRENHTLFDGIRKRID